MDNKRLAVHDLVWISDDSELYSPSHPEWAREALRRTPAVVVRRAQAPPNFVAVGVRGADREQRHATVLCLSDVRACTTPESLAAERAWANEATQISAHFRDALTAVSEYGLKERLVWGPIGSVGYQLLTKISVTNLSSDLDVMIRCHVPPDRNQMRMFDEHLRTAPVRVDVVLEGPCGGVAMREYLNGEEVLIKDSRGARIGSFIWQDL
jgi:phosphoribosyl-dephospho-CoA transferase